MSTRVDYRTALINKLRDVANNLGKTQFSTTELNEMLGNAPRRLFPDVYKTLQSASLTPDLVTGTLDLTSAAIDANTVTRMVDDMTYEPIWGWQAVSSTRLIHVDVAFIGSTVTVQYMAPHTMPADDVTVVTIPDVFFDMTVMAAAMDALERYMNDRTKLRGFKPSGETGVDENEILNAYDTLGNSLKNERQLKGMGLPAVGAG